MNRRGFLAAIAAALAAPVVPRLTEAASLGSVTWRGVPLPVAALDRAVGVVRGSFSALVEVTLGGRDLPPGAIGRVVRVVSPPEYVGARVVVRDSAGREVEA